MPLVFNAPHISTTEEYLDPNIHPHVSLFLFFVSLSPCPLKYSLVTYGPLPERNPKQIQLFTLSLILFSSPSLIHPSSIHLTEDFSPFQGHKQAQLVAISPQLVLLLPYPFPSSVWVTDFHSLDSLRITFHFLLKRKQIH